MLLICIEGTRRISYWGNNGMMRLVPRLINEVKNLILEQELTIEEIQILWTLLTKRRVLEPMVY